ncbi:hypothetical protein KIPB_003474, partial [Kipferlia bialata]|eukprot:g3474.t1
MTSFLGLDLGVQLYVCTQCTMSLLALLCYLRMLGAGKKGQ